jgi:hypothetical protein
VVGRISFALERFDLPRHCSHVAQLWTLGRLRVMKRASETIMAQRLLVTRTHGFAILPFFRLRAKSYILYSMLVAVILFLLAFSGFWFVFSLVVAFLLGVLFVYIRWLRGMRKSWPFLSRVMSWDEVKRISEDEPSA